MRSCAAMISFRTKVWGACAAKVSFRYGTRAGDGVALFLRGLDVLGDDIVGDEGTDAVVEQHDAVVRVLGLRLLQKVVDGVLRAGTAGDDLGHLGEAVLFTERFHVRDIVFQCGDVDLVDLRVPLEQTDRVDQDRHGVDLEELFRDTGTHTDAAAAGKDQSDIHKRILLFGSTIRGYPASRPRRPFPHGASGRRSPGDVRARRRLRPL